MSPAQVAVQRAIRQNEAARRATLARRRERANNERHSQAFYAWLMRQPPTGA